MNRAERKKTLQDALGQATVAHTISAIARESGIDSAQKLYDFRQRDALNPDDEKRLELWLAQNGYYDPDDGQSQVREKAVYYKADSLCPECGEAIPGREQGFLWCGKCGAVLGLVCPECSWVGPLEAKFCQQCATPLTEPARRELRRDTEEIEKLSSKKKRSRKKKKGAIDY